MIAKIKHHIIRYMLWSNKSSWVGLITDWVIFFAMLWFLYGVAIGVTVAFTVEFIWVVL